MNTIVALLLLVIALGQAEQPLPFSHKTHVELGLECQVCHAMPEPGDAATIPATATCMGCHDSVKTESAAIQQLAQAHERAQPIPWKRVYRVPDFVAFSHKTHVTQGAVACEICHGQVRELDVMRKLKETSMASCVECHTEKGAPNTCTTCHDPM